jgi:hypothetical protein
VRANTTGVDELAVDRNPLSRSKSGVVFARLDDTWESSVSRELVCVHEVEFVVYAIVGSVPDRSPDMLWSMT